MRLRCSAMERARHCLHWAHESVGCLPEGRQYPRYIGSLVHSILARVICGEADLEEEIGRQKPAVEKRLRSLALQAALDLPRPDALVESSVTWDAVGDRILDEYISESHDMIPGRLDLVYMSKYDGLPTYRDWKTSSVSELGDYEGQMAFGALLIARKYGVWQVATELVSITKTCKPYRRVHHEFELLDTMQECRAMIDVLARSDPPPPIIGAWCKYCKADCPSNPERPGKEES